MIIQTTTITIIITGTTAGRITAGIIIAGETIITAITHIRTDTTVTIITTIIMAMFYGGLPTRLMFLFIISGGITATTDIFLDITGELVMFWSIFHSDFLSSIYRQITNVFI